MPTITIADATIARLQKHAVPLVDDFDSVINKLIDEKESKSPSTSSPSAKMKEFVDGKSPSLTHTKMLSAQVGGKALPPSGTNWNRLLDEVILLAAAKLKDVKELKQLVIVNSVVGKKEDQGYRHIAKAGISIQGQDAAAAWKAAAHILKALHIPAEVVFMWYDNDKAAHPGQTGKLTVN